MTSSVTCFKAIAGAEADSAAGDILDALGDDRLSDIDMEPLDTSDLVSENKRCLSILSILGSVEDMKILLQMFGGREKLLYFFAKF